jgi:Family of unknown function (DUF5343)
MAIQPEGNAPYAPPATVIEFVKAYRERTIPTPITGAVLERVGVNASLVPRVTQTLRLLDLLTDENQPTTQLEDLRKAPGSEFQERFAALLRAVYADVFQYVDPASDPLEKVTDQFRHYEPRGQIKRMVTLFLTLCEFAGILPEGSVQKRRVTGPSQSAPAPRARKPVTPVPKSEKPAEPPRDHLPPVYNPLIEVAPHPLLAGMLSALPPIPADWPRSKSTLDAGARKAWLTAVAANLDVLYDLGPNGDAIAGGGSQE